MQNGQLIGNSPNTVMRIRLGKLLTKICRRCIFLISTLTGLVTFLVVTTGCSEKCLVLPSVELLDSVQYEDEVYYLYSRTTGIQEKQTFFELYKNKPEIDACREANIKAVAIVPHDHKRYVDEVILQPNSANLLQITFTDDINKGYENTNAIRFEN